MRLNGIGRLVQSALLIPAVVILLAAGAVATDSVDGNGAHPAPDFNVQPGDYALLAGRKIVIDPGHGGQETGAIGFSGTLEKNNTLATAFLVKERLEKYGARVIMTRTDDNIYGEPLRDNLVGRATLANTAQADLFVSIHNDWMPKDTYVGTSTWYWRDESKDLADVMQYNLLKYLQTPNRKVQKAPFVVVKETTMPAVLVELAFLSNPDEERDLGDPTFQAKAADAVTAGLARYLALHGATAVATAGVKAPAATGGKEAAPTGSPPPATVTTSSAR